jgi:hypothetical protein
MYIKQKMCFLLGVLLFCAGLNGQVAADKLRQFVNNSPLSSYSLHSQEQVRQFYAINDFRFNWLSRQNAQNLQLLLNYQQHLSQCKRKRELKITVLFPGL